MSIAAGWYPDPLSAERLRWWSGDGWTESVQPTSQAAPPPVAPLHAAPVAPVRAAPVAPARRNPAEPAPDVWLPPLMIEYGDLPGTCAQHGRSAVRLQKVTVHSRTPAWAYALLLAGLLIAAIVIAAIRESVTGAWPMCDVCVQRRGRMRSIFWLSVGAWWLLAIAGLLLPSGLLLLLLLPLFVAGVVFRDLSDWRRFTSATVDRATRAVHVRKPSRGFVDGLPDPRRPPSPPTPALVGVRRF